MATGSSLRAPSPADRRLYLVTSGRADLEDFLEAAVRGGVDIVQLRDKELADRHWWHSDPDPGHLGHHLFRQEGLDPRASEQDGIMSPDQRWSVAPEARRAASFREAQRMEERVC